MIYLQLFLPQEVLYIGVFMITAGTKIDVSALAATREEMADVGKTTDLVDITANRVEDEQEDVDKKVE